MPFKYSTFMQVSCASLRMHAACVALPLKAPVSAWSATRRLVSNKSSKTFLHTVQAAEQRTASEDPSNVDIKGRSNEDKHATSTYIKKSVALWLKFSLQFSHVTYVDRFCSLCRTDTGGKLGCVCFYRNLSTQAEGSKPCRTAS